ncbi:hypothetical protein MBRA1_002099 [Malassezia brasiliensis]|uniref:Bola-like protein n=1 Tax=Malassezia brasiliensis TaxID=1821822 RepID=A0AAF0DTJ1_9BASI|nr:hypothetical protein MBRA1_002099 [Malassezia brasiliensis]
MFVRQALRAQRMPLHNMALPRPAYMRSFVCSSVVRSEDLSSPEAKQNRIVSILKEKFQPVDLQVQDVSGGCGSFFAILLKSKAFDGKSTIQAHRMVNKEIKEVIQGIHGLQLKTVAATD